MSNIDQGLDAIISSGGGFSNGATAPKRNRGPRRAKKAAGGSNTKSLGKAVTAVSKASRKRAQRGGAGNAKLSEVASALAVSPIVSAKRVVVSGMPLDVDENAVKEYFATSVGRIRHIKGEYNAAGTSTGSFTITFDKNGSAQKVLEKFHNQPIDGGKSRLRVQVLLDAAAASSAVPGKSLAERIGAPAPASAAASAAAVAAATAGKKKRAGKKAGPAAPVKAGAAPKKAAPKKAAAKKKPAPRTAADLDAEMSDYFASATTNEISV